MMFISKGFICRPSCNGDVFLSRAGKDFHLSGLEAELWIRGRFEFAMTSSDLEEKTIYPLVQKGLIVADQEEDELHKYRLLTRCIFLPVKRRFGSARLNSLEKKIYQWILKAGIHLSLAELVFLNEYGIGMDKALLREENRQNLVMTIYTKDNIQDNLLEHQMEEAACRDEVVSALERLIRKKKILIV